MKKYEEQLTQDAIFLHRYLWQYRRCIDRKKSLDQRRKDILEEFSNPLKGLSYSGVPGGSGNNSGCAVLSLRLSNIEIRIMEQREKSVKILEEIMNVIEFLPENTMERIIIEHRYIDRYSWNRICMEVHLSRTPATKYWRRGLYQLLECKKVWKILKDYKKMNDREEAT